MSISIHALFAEGDLYRNIDIRRKSISIHALFAEGDEIAYAFYGNAMHFYPRPLRRGRPRKSVWCPRYAHFYPRPLRRGRPDSGSRAPYSGRHFYPRPLRRGRRSGGAGRSRGDPISIHALFAEGDICFDETRDTGKISIHALFAEGDQTTGAVTAQSTISIHALFAEGDAHILCPP